MAFEVKVILDSVATCGKRLTTITATYPRVVHSEVLTHRDRARNSASSRAIPFPKMSEMIDSDPFIPIKWGAEQGSMQTGDEIPEELRPFAKMIWLESLLSQQRYANTLHYIGKAACAAVDGNVAIAISDQMSPSEIAALVRWVDEHRNDDDVPRIHKSIPNRLIEPWMWITVVMTATEWNNFFRLRCHPDAEIHFQKIAGMIRDALDASTPTPRDAHEQCGKWHLPFIRGEDWDWAREATGCEPAAAMDRLCRVSVARCARVSYLTHEGVRDPEKDLGLFEKLSNGSGFGHWSPMEHVAQACCEPLRSGPFVGWKQYRKEFALENAAG